MTDTLKVSMVMQTLTFIIPLQQVIGSSGDLPPPVAAKHLSWRQMLAATRRFLSGKQQTRSKNGAGSPTALNIPRRQDDILQIILQFYQRWF